VVSGRQEEQHETHGQTQSATQAPTAEQLDERVELPDDPAKVIEAILNVDPNAPEAGKATAKRRP
jgi:hypothetical protein